MGNCDSNVTDIKEIFLPIFGIVLHILILLSAQSYLPFNSINGKKFVFIMKLFLFKYNTSNLDILKSVVKLWKCHY